MKEIWKDIKGYEGLYQVSNLGKVKSLNYKRMNTEQILKSNLGKNGYLKVSLHKNGKIIFKSIHRLVAENFVDNKLNQKYIDHKDCNKLNNNVNNLEWVTLKENSHRAKANGLYRFSSTHPKSKVIEQYDKDFNFIKKWDSIMDIERQLHIPNSNIVDCCKRRRKTTRGFIFRYAYCEEKGIEIEITKKKVNNSFNIKKLLNEI